MAQQLGAWAALPKEEFDYQHLQGRLQPVPGNLIPSYSYHGYCMDKVTEKHAAKYPLT